MKKIVAVVIGLFLFMILTGFLQRREGPKFVKGELLVKYKPTIGAETVTTSLERIKATRIAKLRRIDALKIKLPSDLNVEAALRILKQDPSIEYVEPNYIYYLDLMPSDPKFNDQWGLHNTSTSGGTADADIDAPEAWDLTVGNPGIIVAITDTGIDYNHEDLKTNMWQNPGETAGDGIDNDGNGYVDDIYGYDFGNDDPDPMDDHDHGTHVAGIIGAVSNNNKGIAGTNFQSRLMALKFINPIECGGIVIGTGGDTADAAEAILYASDNGAKIINASWGGGSESATLKDAISYADSAGVLFVAAAGNEGTDNDTAPHYPSNYGAPPHNLNNVIAVAASDHNDNLASFSNFGDISVHLAAPGQDILSTIIGNDYEKFDGTSMAAPHVAGVAALVWANDMTRSHTQVKTCILDYVDTKAAFTNKVITDGRLNAFRAVKCSPTADNSANDRWLAAMQNINISKDLRYVGRLKLKYHSDHMKVAGYYLLMFLPIGFIIGWKIKIRRKQDSQGEEDRG